MDRSTSAADRFPEIGSRHGGRVHYAHGFAGNGAGPARLAGRILAALVDDPDDPLARLPLVGRRQRILPPEPFRFLGARLIREALIRRDDALDAGRKPGLLVRAVARATAPPRLPLRSLTVARTGIFVDRAFHAGVASAERPPGPSPAG